VKEAGSEGLGRRTRVLRELGANDEQLDGLLAYTATAYGSIDPAAISLPFADEPHIEAWQQYAEDAERMGVFPALQQRFVQLQFPVRSGISEDEAYRRATRRGDLTAADAFAPGVELEEPSALELQIHQSVAGRIPVLVPSTRADFVTLVQAFTERNEPVPVPDSMGACLVNGLNNWDRVATYRRRWRDSQGADAGDDGWAAEFKLLAAQKPLYQDRFIILSRGPYSATAAADAGVAHDEWIRRSLAIRREHECVHYLTYRLSGIIRSNVLDELVADFAGLVAATGEYSRDLALRFLGLHHYPDIPDGSRLRVYRGALTEAQLRIVGALARQAAGRLEECARHWGPRLRDLGVLAAVVGALVTVSVEEVADGIVPLPGATVPA
jgi:hypothetical protein